MDQFSDFSTVDDFLRHTASAKSDKRKAIASGIAPHLNDEGMVGIPPVLAKDIEALLHGHGDEAYRQISLFALGKWFELHIGMSEEYFEQGDPANGASSLMDATRISDALHLMAEVKSFGGSKSWKKMLNETLSQFILEEIEELGK